jgi:hypothetical protein
MTCPKQRQPKYQNPPTRRQRSKAVVRIHTAGVVLLRVTGLLIALGQCIVLYVTVKTMLKSAALNDVMTNLLLYYVVTQWKGWGFFNPPPRSPLSSIGMILEQP